MERFIVELTALNQCGVLDRITEVYSKHKYNIDTLTAVESDTPGFSFIRIVSRGDVSMQTRITRYLRKLMDVKTVLLVQDTNN